MKKIKIVFYVSKLTAGGAERVFSLLINNLPKNKFKIYLVTADDSSPHYSVNSNVTFFNLKTNIFLSPFIFQKFLVDVKPKIVITTVSYFNIYFSIFRFIMPKNIIYIARETNIISFLNRDESFFKGYILGSLLSRIFFRKGFDFFISQTNQMKLSMIEHYKINSDKIKIIGNPFVDNKFYKNHKYKNKVNLLSVGRLHPQKGYLRVLNSLELLNMDFNYTIIGTGPQKQEILNYLSSSSIKENVYLYDTKPNEKIFELIKKNDILLLGSYHEGFPNIVLESSNFCLPVVSFNCNHCLDEVIFSKLNGIITDSDSIIDFAKNIEIAKDFKFNFKKAKILLNKKYGLKKIVDEYDNFFSEII